MKQKKATGKRENVIDFRGLMDKKKMNDMCSLDYEEFKSAVTRLILSMVEAMGKNNQKIDKSFEGIIEHLKIMNKELSFLKQVLYVERILNGEHRDGRMTIEYKKSLAKSFGIDFNRFVKQLTDTDKRSKCK
ncbi:MAG: hypothetical protein ACLP9S_03420 [Syntrophales bacterium]